MFKSREATKMIEHKTRPCRRKITHKQPICWGNSKMKQALIRILTRAVWLAAANVAATVVAASATASPLDSIESLNQAQFDDFAREFGAATHYKSVSPSEPLGSLGFDIGLRVSSTDIDGDLFDLASSGDFDGTELIIAGISVHKGLILGLDIGASLSLIPGVDDATLLGAELRYNIVEGNVAVPSVGLRASHSIMQGVDELDLQSTALELGISKGFLFATPYAGVGIVSTELDAVNVDSLSSTRDEQRKLFVGATINLGLAITLEADQTGDTRTYTAKAGIRF